MIRKFIVIVWATTGFIMLLGNISWAQETIILEKITGKVFCLKTAPGYFNPKDKGDCRANYEYSSCCFAPRFFKWTGVMQGAYIEGLYKGRKVWVPGGIYGKPMPGKYQKFNEMKLVKISHNKVYVRNEPTFLTDTYRICNFCKVTVIGQKGAWVYVDFNGRKGWIYGELVGRVEQ